MSELKNNRNIIHVDNHYLLFLGRFADNKIHRHYAIQISIKIEKALQVIFDNETVDVTTGLHIGSNVRHSLSCDDFHLLFLVSPFSKVGHYLRSLDAVSDELKQFIQYMHLRSNAYLNGKVSQNEFIQLAHQGIDDLSCSCQIRNHVDDERISRALDFLIQNRDRVTPAEELADYCNLSKSRFLHLFQENMAISYRRVQLWIKVRSSLPFLTQQNITKTAHQFGFTDSAHYSKVFKENFGFSPKQLLMFSQFVQV